jgi:hypothetical protein
MGYGEQSTEGAFHKAIAGLCVLATLGALAWAVGTSFAALL